MTKPAEWDQDEMWAKYVGKDRKPRRAARQPASHQKRTAERFRHRLKAVGASLRRTNDTWELIHGEEIIASSPTIFGIEQDCLDLLTNLVKKERDSIQLSLTTDLHSGNAVALQVTGGEIYVDKRHEKLAKGYNWFFDPIRGTASAQTMKDGVKTTHYLNRLIMAKEVGCPVADFECIKIRRIQKLIPGDFRVSNLKE